MNNNPETVQIGRHPARISLFSAMIFVETSKDQQIWTIFSNRMVSHFALCCRLSRLQIGKYEGEGNNAFTVLLLL